MSFTIDTAGFDDLAVYALLESLLDLQEDGLITSAELFADQTMHVVFKDEAVTEAALFRLRFS